MAAYLYPLDTLFIQADQRDTEQAPPALLAIAILCFANMSENNQGGTVTLI